MVKNGLKTAKIRIFDHCPTHIKIHTNPRHMYMSRKLSSSSIQKSSTHKKVPHFRLSTQTIKQNSRAIDILIKKTYTVYVFFFMYMFFFKNHQVTFQRFCIGESCYFDRRFEIPMKNGPPGFFETYFSMEKNGFQSSCKILKIF